MPEEAPMTFQRLGDAPPAPSATGNPLFDCKWKLIEPSLEGPAGGIVLTVASDSVCVKVANMLRVGATVGDDGAISTSGPMIATRMMAPDALKPSENEMGEMLKGINGWKLDGDILIITSESGTYKWSMLSNDAAVDAKPMMVPLS